MAVVRLPKPKSEREGKDGAADPVKLGPAPGPPGSIFMVADRVLNSFPNIATVVCRCPDDESNTAYFPSTG